MKTCAVCGAPRPKGRVRYCGDSCASWATLQRTRARDDKRLGACKRCQGPKEPGIRGSKYCAECRTIVADSSAHREYERARRRTIRETTAKVSTGKRVKRRMADAPPGQKWCARCQSFRRLTSFALLKEGRRAAYCLPCQRSYNQERRIRLTWGLSWEEYEQLLEGQGGRCAICEGQPRKNALCVDHDHKTGEIRGLLCKRCNHRLLGAANDDPARLRKAADYLEAGTARSIFGAPRMVPGQQEAAS